MKVTVIFEPSKIGFFEIDDLKNAIEYAQEVSEYLTELLRFEKIKDFKILGEKPQIIIQYIKGIA